MDRRRSPRLDINLRCTISVPGMEPELLEGVTENISRGDVLIALGKGQTEAGLPSVGDLLTVDILLPANHAFGRKCMHCQATVVRVTKSEDAAARLALRIHKMSFQSCEKAGASVRAVLPEPHHLVM